MSENIEKVLSRGEKLDLLVDKTDNLMFEVGGGVGKKERERGVLAALGGGRVVRVGGCGQAADHASPWPPANTTPTDDRPAETNRRRIASSRAAARCAAACGGTTAR